jgi:predicted nucleic acid-binding protein
VLDSDTVIYLLGGNETVIGQFLSINPDDLATTRINYAELLFGAYNSQRVEHNLARIKRFLAELCILEFDRQASEQFARQKADLKKQGLMIADMDLMIAGICLASESTLVTNNTRHFARIHRLQLTNWTQP